MFVCGPATTARLRIIGITCGSGIPWLSGEFRVRKGFVIFLSNTCPQWAAEHYYLLVLQYIFAELISRNLLNARTIVCGLAQLWLGSSPKPYQDIFQSAIFRQGRKWNLSNMCNSPKHLAQNKTHLQIRFDSICIDSNVASFLDTVFSKNPKWFSRSTVNFNAIEIKTMQFHLPFEGRNNFIIAQTWSSF